ncbi:MAG: aldo/keto reductase [bacterium]|nr:aldo/keto reductase [bacterium]
MQLRQLGHNGPDISSIGLGAWPIGGGMGDLNEADNIATIRAAIDSGITLVDTAQAYRTSEGTLGRALRDGYRQRCFLATKVSGKYAPKDIELAIHNSLRSLDTDCVDLYQVHSWNANFPIEETMATMARLQEQGKTRFIGVSNFNAEQMEMAYRIAPFHSSQPRYNMFDRNIEAEDLAYCAGRGIGILAHSPLAKGLLTGKYAANHTFPEDDERSKFPRFQGDLFARYLAVADSLTGVAAAKGCTRVQLAIAWLLRRSEVTCVLVGAKSVDQVRDALSATQITFTDGELEHIDALLKDTPKG